MKYHGSPSSGSQIDIRMYVDRRTDGYGEGDRHFLGFINNTEINTIQ